MAVQEYYGAKGTLTAGVSAVATVIEVSPELSGAIATTFVNGDSITYLSIETGSFYEIVKVTQINGNQLLVERAQLGTIAYAFPIGAKVQYVLTSAAISDGIDIQPVYIYGQDLVTVEAEADNNWRVTVEEPQFNGHGPIEITGDWPEYNIYYTPQESDCCDGGGSGSDNEDAIEDIFGNGIVEVSRSGSSAYINVDEPQFYGYGIDISGSWPTYTFTVDNSGGGGTVTLVGAGAGLSLTGSPTINPTLSITNTGVVPGDYGGFVINARGQITNVPATFNPISVLVPGNAITISRVGDTATINAVDAAIGVKGVVSLADPLDPFDPDDETNVATPAVIAKALDTLVLATAAGNFAFNSEPDASYTNVLAVTYTAISLLAGDTALIVATVTMLDGTTPATPVAFGMCIADVTGTTTKVQGDRIMTQNQQTMQFVVTGPLTGTLAIATTAPPAGATVVSASLSVVQV